MTAILEGDFSDTAMPRPPKIAIFIAVSVLIHLVLFFLGVNVGGIYGVPGPGGGDALVFQLAAGDAHDRFAAPLAPEVKQEAVVEKPKVKAQPKPKPKPEVAPRKKKDEAPRPVVEEPKEEPLQEPQQELTLEEELAGMGLPGGKGRGAGGNALETFKNKKGTSLSGGEIATQMTGRSFHLEMGRIDIRGGNRLINTVIQLNPDGTSVVTLTHYFFQTFHGLYSSTRSESATGTWWVDGNRWCHQSKIISYNTKDCYDLTSDGPVVRLYYAPCTRESSQLCKSGRLAGEGEVK